jgi:hypothetical protein
MPDVHMKGYILQLIARNEAMWDYEVAENVMEAYGISGDYWYGTVRLTLTDLFSGGLLDERDSTVDPEKSFGEERVLLKFGLNEFGLERMRQTGLMKGVTP